MSTYVRPRPLDPTALRDATAAHKRHNDEMAARFAAEEATGALARLEAEDRAIAERRMKRKGSAEVIVQTIKAGR
jgi:hypothetical protein